MDEINPYASPEVDDALLFGDGPSGGIWQQRGLLVMRKNATLPNICVKSNQPCDGPRLKRVLYWHHPAIYLALLAIPATIWIYVILALIIRKKAVVWIPLSAVWWARRRRAIAIGWSIAALGAISIICGPVLAGLTHADGWYGAIFVGILIMLGGAVYGASAARMIAPKRIDENYAWIKGVHPNYLASLPIFGQ